MKFSLFNVEEDPASQGFEEGTNDLVIAASVSLLFAVIYWQ